VCPIDRDTAPAYNGVVIGKLLASVVLALAFAVPAATASAQTGASAQPAGLSAAPLCRAGYYENVDGVCVHRPTKATHPPKGATAKCRDGTYSFSKHASGTCSHHGGVARWIHHP
jgi:hypothetical protein